MPQFKNESSCETIQMKMTLVCMKMDVMLEHIFIYHFETEAKGNSKMACCFSCVIQAF